ncbi:Uncharacterised protein g9347 [Pycnogonum litorale]
MIWILTISSVLLYVTPVIATGSECVFGMCVKSHEQCNYSTQKCVCTTDYTANDKGVCISDNPSVLTLILLGTLLPVAYGTLFGILIICYRRYDIGNLGPTGSSCIRHIEQPATVYQTAPLQRVLPTMKTEQGYDSPPPYPI